MSIPDSRNRTYASAQRVARADILWMEDQIVAAYRRRRRPLRVHRISPFSAEPPRMTWPASATDLDWQLKLPVGTRIRSITTNVFRSSGVLTLALRRSPASAPLMVDVSSTTGGTAGVFADLTLTFAYPYHTIAAGFLYGIRLTRGSASDDLSGLEMAIDIP